MIFSVHDPDSGEPLRIVARPRRKRDACYRDPKVYTLRELRPEMLTDEQAIRKIVEQEGSRATAPVGGRWPVRGVGPVVKISTSMDFYFIRGLAALRMDRGWIEPAW